MSDTLNQASDALYGSNVCNSPEDNTTAQLVALPPRRLERHKDVFHGPTLSIVLGGLESFDHSTGPEIMIYFAARVVPSFEDNDGSIGACRGRVSV